MSFDRAATGTGIGADPAPAPGHVAPASPSASLRLQILSTEHWSLLASRSLAWNVSFSRAGMFLSTLSGAIVALALVAQASAFGDSFTLFALVILPVVLFIGLATFVRLGASNYHDRMCVIGMNRIRAAYLELAPDLERYFVTSGHDDPRGVGISMGVPYGSALPLVHLFAATPTVILVLNSVILGAIVALAALRLGAGTPAVLGAGAVGFILGFIGQGLFARQTIAGTMARYHPLFPTRTTPNNR
jgi:hypothetical protein